MNPKRPGSGRPATRGANAPILLPVWFSVAGTDDGYNENLTTSETPRYGDEFN